MNLLSDSLQKDKYYKKLGFKCGLEIHQRLATAHKLFCSCSARPGGDKKIAVITRNQRAVAGELGAMDRSSAFESSKRRGFRYNIFRETSCLVDIDEEPPHNVDSEAVEIALRIAGSLNADVPDEIEPMRKGVVDGSDPSAFQRSMVIGYSGYIEVKKKKITISSIFLEEESSGIVNSTNESVEYDVDRLGIPLIEIDTAPEISTPAEAKEVALKIGLLLRLTGKVQRGIGTIRQDVNVSIAGGTRVEIKGVQDLATMDLLVENEVERQVNLIKIKDELNGKKAKVGDIVDVTELFNNSSAKIIGNVVKSGGQVLALKLTGFKSLLGHEINPGRRLGSEISDYAKMAGVKGIIHSDEDLSKYDFSEKEIGELAKRLELGKEGSFVLVAAPKDVCLKAIAFAKERAETALTSVPGETRAAIDNAVTKFMRPIPGGSRMYPETDAVPINVDVEKYRDAAKSRIDPDKTIKKLEVEIGNKQIASQMLWSEELPTYNYLIEMKAASPELVAVVLLERFRELKREGIDVGKINADVLAHIFKKYSEGNITKAGVNELLRYTPISEKDVDRLIEQKKLTRISGAGLMEILEDFKAKDGADVINNIMSQYRLNVDGEELNALVKKRGK